MSKRMKRTAGPSAYVHAGSVLLLLQLAIFLLPLCRHNKSIPGLICMFFGVFLWVVAAIHLKSFGKRDGGAYMLSETLVDRGVYSLIRHPQYLSFVIYSAGITMIIPPTLPVSISVAVLFHLASRAEDRELEGRFGVLFRSYCEHAGGAGRPILKRRHRSDKKS